MDYQTHHRAGALPQDHPPVLRDQDRPALPRHRRQRRQSARRPAAGNGRHGHLRRHHPRAVRRLRHARRGDGLRQHRRAGDRPGRALHVAARLHPALPGLELPGGPPRLRGAEARAAAQGRRRPVVPGHLHHRGQRRLRRGRHQDQRQEGGRQVRPQRRQGLRLRLQRGGQTRRRPPDPLQDGARAGHQGHGLRLRAGEYPRLLLQHPQRHGPRRPLHQHHLLQERGDPRPLPHRRRTSAAST